MFKLTALNKIKHLIIGSLFTIVFSALLYSGSTANQSVAIGAVSSTTISSIPSIAFNFTLSTPDSIILPNIPLSYSTLTAGFANITVQLDETMPLGTTLIVSSPNPSSGGNGKTIELNTSSQLLIDQIPAPVALTSVSLTFTGSIDRTVDLPEEFQRVITYTITG